MNPSPERFIDLATRPLAPRPELLAQAAAGLRERIGDAPESAAGIAQAVAALESADRHPRRRGWQVALGGLALAVSLPVLVHAFWQIKTFASLSEALSPAEGRFTPEPTGSLTAQERLILQGDPSAGGETDRWKALWAADPQNPAFLLEYAKASLSEKKTFSPDIREAAARIDSDNAWYDVMEASGKAERGVEKRVPGYSERQRGAKTTYHLLDESELDAALAQLHAATRKRRFVSSDAELQSRRTGLLPERTDFVSQYPRFLLTATKSPDTLRCRYLADAVSLQAGRLAQAKDEAGFRQLVADWEWLVESTCQSGVTLLDVMVAKAVFAAPLPALTEAAQALGLNKEAAAFATQRDWHDAKLKGIRRRSAETRTTPGSLFSSKGSGLHHTALGPTARQPENPPPITEADVRPGRLADHAILGRAWALASWAVLGLLAVLAVVECASGREPARSLANRLGSLFGARDWARMLGGGVIAPLGWTFLVTRLSPLSAGEWMIGYTGGLAPGLQLGAVTVLILTASAIAISRRLGKRAGFLGLESRWPKLGLAALAMAALAVPAAGAFPFFGEPAFLTSAAFSGLALLWLVWRAAATRFGLEKPPKRPLRSAMFAGMAAPVLVFAMAACSLLAAAQYLEERHWISQDRLMEITTATAGIPRYEMQAAATLRAELMADLRSVLNP